MDTGRDGGPEHFRLLFVCTGNICRSPFAHLLARAMLDVRLGPAWGAWFTVASGGTSAVVGSEMHPTTRGMLGPRAHHADVAAFRSRQVPARDVELADLVLTAGRSHRGQVLELAPKALRSTFTLLEFVRLLGVVDHAALPADPLSRARALVDAARDKRGVLPPVPAEEDAVPDPISGGPEEHAEAARVIHGAVRAVVDAIGGGLPPHVPPGMRPPPRPGPPGPVPFRPPPPGWVPAGAGPQGPGGGGPPPRGPAPAVPGPPRAAAGPPGPVPQGAVPQGAVPQGPVPQGPVPQGAVPQGAVPQGAVPQGPVPPEPAGPGPGRPVYGASGLPRSGHRLAEPIGPSAEGGPSTGHDDEDGRGADPWRSRRPDMAPAAPPSG